MMLTVIGRQDAATLSTEALMAVMLIMLMVLTQHRQRFTGVQIMMLIKHHLRWAREAVQRVLDSKM